MSGTGFLGAHADEVYRVEADDLYLVGTSEVPLAGYHADEILDLSGRAAALRGLVVVLPPRSRQLRQGHPRHHPGAPVRQGRGVRLLQARRRRGRASAAAGLAARDAGPHRGALSGNRRGRRRSRLVGGPQVRLRGVGADAAGLPRADLDVELHHLPGAPAGHPLPGSPPASRRSPRRSTARWPPPAGWSPSWRTTSGPTAVCGFPTRWCRSSAPRCWSRPSALCGHEGSKGQIMRSSAELSSSDRRPACVMGQPRRRCVNAMGWLRLWWRQSDHYDELSSHLADPRHGQPHPDAPSAVIAGGLALVALATIWTPTGPTGRCPAGLHAGRLPSAPLSGRCCGRCAGRPAPRRFGSPCCPTPASR